MYAQSKNLITAALRVISFGSLGSRTKVGVTIGQLAAPSVSTRLTAKLGVFQSADAAAAVKLAVFGSTKTPDLLRSWAVVRLFSAA